MSESLRAPVFVVVLAVLTAGCTGLLASDGVSGDDISDRLDETAPPETVSATVETTVTTDGETKALSEEIWLRADGTSRTEGIGDESYTWVNDGERVWQQDSSGDVTYYERGDLDESRLERIYAEQRTYFDRFEVTAVEETTVDERDVYHVVFEPPRNETVERSIDVLVDETVYQIPLETSLEDDEGYAERIELKLDEETLFPLEYRVETEDSSLEISHEDVSFDEEFDEELFEPLEDDAADEILLPEIDHYNTVDEAESEFEFAVQEPEPDAVPDGFELDTVQGTTYPDEDRSQITLLYRNGDGSSIHVAVGDGPREYPADGESLVVEDVDVALEETEQGIELDWELDGTYYHVYGGETLDRESVLDIAASVIIQTR